MPFVFLLAFQILAPDYVPNLFHRTLGIIALIGRRFGTSSAGCGSVAS